MWRNGELFDIQIALVAASLWEAQRLAQRGGYSLRFVID